MLSENGGGGWGLAILRTQPALGHPRLLFLHPVNPVDLLGGKPVLVPPSVGFSSQPGCNPSLQDPLGPGAVASPPSAHSKHSHLLAVPAPGQECVRLGAL